MAIPRFAWFTFALFLVVALGLLDQLESHYLSLLIFYLVPISIATWLVAQRAGYVTLTVGAITCAHPQCAFDSLMTAADRLMYAAKRSGKDSFKHEEII
jgi:GGDEF domain-containing protein